MKTKKILLLFYSILFFINFSYAQEYKKDPRNQITKEDALYVYNEKNITKIDLLKALEMLGVNIFKFDVGEFDKKYNISLTMNEYVNGVKQSSKEIMEGENIYYYSMDSVYTEESEILYDYSNQLSFYTKVKDSIVYVEVSDYNKNNKFTFSEKKEREAQFYSWRYYKYTPWKLNEEIPLLIYASSWFDSKNEIERFCGVAILAQDDADTEELLDSSLHYFCFSIKVTEIE